MRRRGLPAESGASCLYFVVMLIVWVVILVAVGIWRGWW